MKTFRVSIEDGKVWCDVEKVRVRPGKTKKFDVRFAKDFDKDYMLKLSLGPSTGKGDCLRMERQTNSFVKLIDVNNAPGEYKFGIELEPLQANLSTPTPLDPIVVNE